MTPRAVPPDGGESRVVSFCVWPSARSARFRGEVWRCRWRPGVEVALPCVGQGEVVGGEPVEQRDRGSYVLPDEDDLVVGGVGASCASAQPAQQVPDRVAVQQCCSSGSARSAMVAVDPAFESDHVLVAGGQGSRGDQDAAQVLDGLAGGQLVECLVGEGASGELTQDRGRGAFVEPALSVCGRSGRGQGPVEGLPVGRDGAGVVGEQFVQAPGDRAAGAPAGGGTVRVGRSRGRCARRVGPGAGRAERLVEGAAADRRDLAAAGAAGPPLLAGVAPGLAGGLGDHARCGRARRSRRSATGEGRTPHSGPSGVRT